MRSLFFVALMSTAFPLVAAPPLGADAPVAGQRTQVMTLGSFHLRERKGFNPAWLASLIDRLAAFRPDIITIEGVSGEQCAVMKADPDLYADAYKSYCQDLGAIEAATGLTVTQANVEIRKTFETWPATPTANQRRRLAVLFLAAGDRWSAQVQWLRLPAAERRAADGIDADMLDILQRKDGKINENFDVAAVLAARIGLDRVYPVDDHTSDGVLAHTSPGFDAALTDHFTIVRRSPLFADHEQAMAGIVDPQSTLDHFRAMNRPHAQAPQIKGDFGGALSHKSEGLWGRHYVGWWDVRNLRMAANIRASFATRPGARVLNIVGSSHKPWYDAYMGMMADVEVVDAETVLR
jgi:Family of unknown function (DUF5694)